VVSISGIVFFFIGIVMMAKGMAAHGSVDIQSAFVSGKITTGSAGLFVVFFAFLMIALSLIIRNRETTAGITAREHRVAQRAFFSVLVALLGCVAGAAFGPKESRGAFFLFGGLLVPMAYEAMTRYLQTAGPQSPETANPPLQPVANSEPPSFKQGGGSGGRG
jgi:hypothetical protein